MKRKQKQLVNQLAALQVEQQRQGVVVRAASWSKNGERKNARKNRRQAKAELRDY